VKRKKGKRGEKGKGKGKRGMRNYSSGQLLLRAVGGWDYLGFFSLACGS